MNTRPFKFGYLVGTAVRECLRSIRTPAQSSAVAFPPQPRRTQPQVISASRLVELCHTPAMVRANGVDLNEWFDSNVHEVKPQSKPRKPRSRKPASATAAVNATSLFLDGIFLDSIDISTFSEASWDLCSR
jgi:hypothetical protein